MPGRLRRAHAPAVSSRSGRLGHHLRIDERRLCAVTLRVDAHRRGRVRLRDIRRRRVLRIGGRQLRRRRAHRYLHQHRQRGLVSATAVPRRPGAAPCLAPRGTGGDRGVTTGTGGDRGVTTTVARLPAPSRRVHGWFRRVDRVRRADPGLPGPATRRVQRRAGRSNRLRRAGAAVPGALSGGSRFGPSGQLARLRAGAGPLPADLGFT